MRYSIRKTKADTAISWWTSLRWCTIAEVCTEVVLRFLSALLSSFIHDISPFCLDLSQWSSKSWLFRDISTYSASSLYYISTIVHAVYSLTIAVSVMSFSPSSWYPRMLGYYGRVKIDWGISPFELQMCILISNVMF